MEALRGTVNRMDSGSSGPSLRADQGHCIVFLGKQDIYLTLVVPLFT